MGNVLFIVTLILSFAYAVFLSWCIYGWVRTKEFKPHTSQSQNRILVSVIIPARNEEDHILSCLQDFIHQDHPLNSFELIVVDDHSSDKTAELVDGFIRENLSMQIRLLKMKDSKNKNLFKKQAIEEAIALSTGELIITTDADCRRGCQWLSTITNSFLESGTEMISAPIIFEKEKGWFEKIQSLEFLGLIAIGAAAIKNNRAFLCNGANLAFRKKAFIDSGGYRSRKDIPTGDDTLLMQNIEKKYKQTGRSPDAIAPIRFIKSLEATVSTRPQHSVFSLLQQRKRWASKIPVQMSAFTVLIAVIAYLLHAGLLLSGLFVLFSGNLAFFLIPLLVKMIPEFILLLIVSSFFGKKNLLFLFLPAQIIYPVYIAVVGLASMNGKYEWKGRSVR